MPQSSYLNGWVAVNKLMREGNGWSGNERNCCFLNVGNGRLANVSAVTRLDLPDDGRALAVTDWDRDGRNDVFLSARTGPRLRLLQNNVGTKTNFVSVKLTGVACNRDAIGARLDLHLGETTSKRKLIRTLRAGEGFLAQSTKWVHFGLGDEQQIDGLEIHWPGGVVQSVTGLMANQRYSIKQGQSPVPVAISANALSDGVEEGTEVDTSQFHSDQARIVLSAPLPMPELNYLDQNGIKKSCVANRATFTLINLWASWCNPCIRELTEFNEQIESLQKGKLDVLALNVDTLETNSDSGTASPTSVKKIERDFRFPHGTATQSLVRTLDVVQRGLLDRQRPLALPTSFLLDEQLRLVVIYKGPIARHQLMNDVERIRRDANNLAEMAVPFPGRWHNKISGPDPLLIALRMIEIGDSLSASEYLRNLQLDSSSISVEASRMISTQLFLARLLAEQGKTPHAIQTFKQVLQIDAKNLTALIGLAHALLREKRDIEAVENLNMALMIEPRHAEAMAYLAMARLRQGRTMDAVQSYQNALRVRPGWLEVSNNLAWILATNSDANVRNGNEAILLAQQICEATNYQVPGMLDTLAAAYAETGRFSDAIETIDLAIKISKVKQDDVQKLLSRRRSYESEQPFRSSSSGGS